jgi:trehalose/maltose hydrolase-like predicted phosphorylase
MFFFIIIYKRNKLRIQPNLPEEWSYVKAKIFWRGQQLLIEADKEKLHAAVVHGSEPVSFIYNNEEIHFKGEITMRLNKKEE